MTDVYIIHEVNNYLQRLLFHSARIKDPLLKKLLTRFKDDVRMMEAVTESYHPIMDSYTEDEISMLPNFDPVTTTFNFEPAAELVDGMLVSNLILLIRRVTDADIDFYITADHISVSLKIGVEIPRLMDTKPVYGDPLLTMINHRLNICSGELVHNDQNQLIQINLNNCDLS